MSDLISRQAAIDVIAEHLAYGTYKNPNEFREVATLILKNLPSVETEWNNHTVACLLAELFDDTCACNYNDIDEWLSEKCEVIDACPNPGGVACWEQFVKHWAERRTDGFN